MFNLSTRAAGYKRIAGTALSLAAALAIGLSSAANAAPGDLDLSFDGDGRRIVNFGGDDLAVSTLVQRDGKIVLVGETNTASGASKLALTRLNPDGSLDPAFSGDGKVTNDPTASDDFAIEGVLQADGKILVLAARDSGSVSNTPYTLVRFQASGKVDGSFGTQGKVLGNFGGNGDPVDVAVQSTGKILVLGDNDNGVAIDRFNSDGTRDSTFGTNGRATAQAGSGASASALAVQPDDKPVATANTETTQNNQAIAVLRFTPDGAPDNSFSGDGKALKGVGSAATSFTFATDVLVQRNGRIALSATRLRENSAGTDFDLDFVVLRFLANGSVDNSFSEDGIAFTSFPGNFAFALALAQQADGKLVLAGAAGQDGGFGARPAARPSARTGRPGRGIFGGGGGGTTGDFLNFALARYTATGALDAAFSGYGRATTDFGPDSAALDVAIQPNGRIVAGGLVGTGLLSGTGPIDFAATRYRN